MAGSAHGKMASRTGLDSEACDGFVHQTIRILAEFTTVQAMDDIVFLEIEPQVISVLDYRQGFGHTELVTW